MRVISYIVFSDIGIRDHGLTLLLQGQPMISDADISAVFATRPRLGNISGCDWLSRIIVSLYRAFPKGYALPQGFPSSPWEAVWKYH